MHNKDETAGCRKRNNGNASCNHNETESGTTMPRSKGPRARARKDEKRRWKAKLTRGQAILEVKGTMAADLETATKEDASNAGNDRRDALHALLKMVQSEYAAFKPFVTLLAPTCVKVAEMDSDGVCRFYARRVLFQAFQSASYDEFAIVDAVTSLVPLFVARSLRSVVGVRAFRLPSPSSLGRRGSWSAGVAAGCATSRRSG